MNIPISKPYFTEDEAIAPYEVILSGWVTQGPKVAEFEQKFAEYVGAKHAVAVSNCTSALHLALLVAGIGNGDEVICPSMSFIATANAIVHAGAKPVFAEINNDYNLDIEHVKNLVTGNTKAVLLVHQIGMPADIDKFSELCKDKGLVLIEDAACAIGSMYKGKKIGSHSDLVCFSFHPRKIITTGDGGMITTSRQDYSDRIKLLRQHGMSVNDLVRHSSSKVIMEEYLEVGYNYRMTDIQAAVGIKQLERLEWILEERRKIAQQYYQALRDIACIQLPTEKEGFYSNYQSYSIILRENAPIARNELMQNLLNDGISTRRGIMTAHREKAYEHYKCQLPNTEFLSDNSIVIPLYVPMKQEEVDLVIEKIRKYLA